MEQAGVVTTLAFNVNGIPGAQGSKRHVGHGVMVESSAKVKPWRSDVKAAAEAALIASDTWERATGPVAVVIEFRFTRPKSHYRTGRNAHLLRDDAPAYCTSRGAGDIDKLERSSNDALVAAGVMLDDSLIVSSRCIKRYCDPEQPAGATFRISPIVEAPVRAPCGIDGCDRPSAGRGWCGTHWVRWRKYGDPMFVKTKGVDYNVATICQFDECDTKARAHAYCSKHLARWLKHGDPSIVLPITGRPTIGTNPGWSAIHKRLSRTRGSAKRQTCVDCAEPAAEWSYDGTDPDPLFGLAGNKTPMPYSLDLSRYVPRCVPCHRAFDREVAS